MDDVITLATLPMPVRWDAVPTGWSTEPLRIEAGPGTDLFVDPGGAATHLNAPRLMGTPPEGDFQLCATVGVDFAECFDAGVLLLWADERHWAKLCFELSPQGEPMVVTVVTRGSSDDANAFLVDSDKVRLRISRVGPAFAFHASVPPLSGSGAARWSFVRYFDLAAAQPVRIGFEAQSPTGKGSAATFEDIRFVAERLTDLRDGS